MVFNGVLMVVEWWLNGGLMVFNGVYWCLMVVEWCHNCVLMLFLCVFPSNEHLMSEWFW